MRGRGKAGPSSSSIHSTFRSRFSPPSPSLSLVFLSVVVLLSLSGSCKGHKSEGSLEEAARQVEKREKRERANGRAWTGTRARAASEWQKRADGLHQETRERKRKRERTVRRCVEALAKHFELRENPRPPPSHLFSSYFSLSLPVRERTTITFQPMIHPDACARITRLHSGGKAAKQAEGISPVSPKNL